jgi:hypothetical protein
MLPWVVRHEFGSETQVLKLVPGILPCGLVDWNSYGETALAAIMSRLCVEKWTRSTGEIKILVDNRFLTWYTAAKDRVKAVEKRENQQEYLIQT